MYRNRDCTCNSDSDCNFDRDCDCDGNKENVEPRYGKKFRGAKDETDAQETCVSMKMKSRAI